MASIHERFGDRMRQLREAAGYSQEGFAAAASIDRTYYSKIERGNANVSLLIIAKIARTLGVKLSELFKRVDGP